MNSRSVSCHWSAPRKAIVAEVWLLGLVEEYKMPRKRHKAEEIVTKLRQELTLHVWSASAVAEREPHAKADIPFIARYYS